MEWASCTVPDFSKLCSVIHTQNPDLTQCCPKRSKMRFQTGPPVTLSRGYSPSRKTSPITFREVYLTSLPSSSPLSAFLSMLKRPKTTADYSKDDDKEEDSCLSKRYFGQACNLTKTHDTPLYNTGVNA